jgi:putative sterol carrier protein
MMEISELTDELRKQAARNVRLGYKVKFVIDDGIIFWDGTGDTPDVGNEEKDGADTTITITAENLKKLMAGGLDPTLAYMTGKLKVEGKMGVALKLTSMFAD